MEGYDRCLESRRVDWGWDEGRNVEQKWEPVKRSMVDNAREVCGSVMVGGKEPKNVWLNDVVKDAVEK